MGSPRTWALKTKTAEDGEVFRAALQGSLSVRTPTIHASYLINLASLDDVLHGKSMELCSNTLLSASNLGVPYVVLHTGSFKDGSFDLVSSRLSESLLRLLDGISEHESPTKLLLENTAGAGGTIGASIEELKWLLDTVGDRSRLGICIDTQHLFAYGYDYRDPRVRSETHVALEREFGAVECVHLNDSKTSSGTKHDRHANIDEGEIGAEALAHFLSSPVFADSVVVLEVPGDGDGPRQQDVDQARTLLQHLLD